MAHEFDPEDLEQLSSDARWSHVTREEFLAAVEPRPYMRLADLGAGSGALLRPILEAVSGKGTFYAVEKSDEARDLLEECLAETPGGHRVEIEEGDDDDAPVGDGEADIVVMGALLAELEDPVSYLRVEALRIVPPEGRLVLLDWSPMDEEPAQDFGTPNDVRIPAQQALAWVGEAGWEQAELRVQRGQAYLITARKPTRG